MNRKLAEIILTKLDAAAYIDRKAGAVQTFEKVFEQDNGVDADGQPVTASVVKRLPYAYINNELVPMIPNGKYKCMIYFEDNGISAPYSSGRGWDFISRLRLICWINTKLLSGTNDSSIVAKIMTDIISKLSGINPYNNSPYTRITTLVTNVPPRDKNIFARYDYDEKVTQYLMQPYDYFALDLQTAFTIPLACLSQITVTLPTSC